MDILSLEGLSAILPVILTIIGFLAASWEKLSKTKLFLKIRTNVATYYFLGKERMFLVVCSLFALIAISSFAIGAFSYLLFLIKMLRCMIMFINHGI